MHLSTRIRILHKLRARSSSLDQVDGQVEALDQFGVLDTSHEQLSHLHLQEVRWQALNLLMVNLQLHGQKGRCLGADFQHSGQAEERHAAEDVELLLLQAVAGLSGLRLH